MSLSRGQCSTIFDETHISKPEQVSLCFWYVFEGKTLETFIGFLSRIDGRRSFLGACEESNSQSRVEARTHCRRML